MCIRDRGGGIWNIVVQINDALQAIGYGLLVLFFAMGLFKNTAVSYTHLQFGDYGKIEEYFIGNTNYAADQF